MKAVARAMRRRSAFKKNLQQGPYCVGCNVFTEAMRSLVRIPSCPQTDFCVTNAVQTEAEFYAEVLAYARELRVFSTFRLRVSDSLGLHCFLGVGVEFIYFLFRKIYESIE